MKPDAIDFLLSRLTWPSVMVRERAATEVARLMVSSDEGDQIKTRLLEWTERQHLESVAAIGLLVLIRAEMFDPTFVKPSLQDLDRAVCSPSLLSWMLLRQFHESNADPSAATAPHCDTAPTSFETMPFFDKHLESFLPPVYAMHADKVQRQTGLPFRRQWAYEWRVLTDGLGVTPSGRVLNFWMSHLPDRYTMIDSRLSDVYRSAYLRTLAWALSTRSLAISDALNLTLRTCPVDLGLWRVEPQPRPNWWPAAEKPSGEIDTVGVEVWRQVQELWEHRESAFGGLVMGHAYGTVHEGDATYLLHIGAMLQKCHGPAVPNADDIASSYFDDNHARLDMPCPLNFEGTVHDSSLAQSIRAVADWTFAPLARAASPKTVPIWQSWRLFQSGVWLPPTFLSNARMTFQCTSEGVEVLDGDKSVGRWQDWTQALRERGRFPPPKNCGNYLLLAPKLVDKVSTHTDASYCWICRLSVYHRKDRYEHSFEHVLTNRLFGGTLLVH